MGAVDFDAEAEWDFDRECYQVWATAEGNRVSCLITRRVFTDYFENPHPTRADIDRIFESHRRIFEDGFRKMIVASDYSAPGEIMLKSTNFQKWCRT
jgi:hypothetical protein